MSFVDNVKERIKFFVGDCVQKRVDTIIYEIDGNVWTYVCGRVSGHLLGGPLRRTEIHHRVKEELQR